jgi:hypothetical protein
MASCVDCGCAAGEAALPAGMIVGAMLSAAVSFAPLPQAEVAAITKSNVRTSIRRFDIGVAP